MTNFTTSNVKQELLDEIDKRVTDKVLEQSNATLLKKLISNADNDNEAISIAALGTTYKRTGLHFDKRIEKTTSLIRYFKKNEKLSFFTDASKPTHKLIVGDNYAALQNLLIQYKGCVNIIYIDPPYGKNNMGEFAKTNYDNAITRDNLLSMLYPRLTLARMLLADNGVIFCSIDDKNQAYVKCLFDDIFGERNHITTFPQKGTGGRQDSKHFAIVHEYMLCYAKNKDNYVSGEVEMTKKYPLFDEQKNLHYKTQLLRKWGDNSRRIDRQNLYYPIYFNQMTCRFSLDKADESCIEIYPMLDAKTEGCWRWGKATMGKAFDEGLVELQKNKSGEYVPYERLYEAPEEKSSKLYSSWLDDVDGSTGTTLLKSILPAKAFDYPKATDLIYKILSMATKEKDAIVLDFFAGSGTTGHAVLEANDNDGEQRTFILCQINEETDNAPNGIAYDVTAKRLKRIMTGECYDGTKDFDWIKYNNPYGGNLDVYDITGVANFETTEGKTPFDVIDETLYGKDRFTTLKEKIDWVCSNFANTQKAIEGDEEWKNRTVED